MMSSFRLLSNRGRFLVTGPAVFASIISQTGENRVSKCAWYSSSPASSSSSGSVGKLPLKKDFGKKSIPEITVYQYKICPFCNRVKAYLDFLNIPYTVVEVNPLTKGEIKFSKDYKKVPLVTIGNTQVNDSSPILEHITINLVATENADKVGFFPEDTQKWSDWSEKRLAVMLYPNITRSLGESWECFRYTSDVLEWNPLTRIGTRVAGAAAMTLANGKIKKKYDIVDERAELDNTLQEWISAVESSSSQGPFLHGAQVTLPDLMVYGVLRSIEGLSTWKEIMDNNPKLRTWYNEVEKETPVCEMISAH
eukprot:GSChrysophyteH2.ASY1.ANO1.1485.1 assembled CDS